MVCLFNREADLLTTAMPFNPEKEEDFLLNEYFIQWAMHPNEESDRFWKSWMEKNPNKTVLLKRAKETLQSFKPVEYHMDEAAGEQLLNNILLRNHQRTSRNIPNRRKSLLRPWAVAASLFFIVGLTSVWLYYNSQPLAPAAIPEQKWLTKTTVNGAKLTFKLPDGSLVRLNANSSITFPAEFADSLREVRLDGQAFFEVEKNPAAPFMVKTDLLQVEVLGTSFDVLAYRDGSEQRVALASGEVSVSSEDGLREVLHPLEMLSYSKEKKEMIKEVFDPKKVLGWKEGIIHFENTSFPEVFKTLERWYGVEISIHANIKFKGRFNGRFDNQSLENVLTGIAYSEGFQFRIDGSRVEIY